ncbi:uncharacterized protein LOC126653820 [Mercurialis annua]|uniref:uncharacterized protein LOC126653820 n=1 Tax=Mercurialis annua TaxID=3986 RepID=UPI00215E6BFA|nr:uncharacterized protein LOC126653820 [Mercurialis annua]
MNHSCCQFFIFLIIFLFTNPAASDEQTQERISYICQMEEFGFCNQTFNENLKNPSTDYVGLTQITINQAIINATNTHAFVLQLLRNATDRGLRNALVVCENGYSIVVQSFQAAFQYFNNKDYRSMMKSEFITPRAQGSCSTSFSVPPFPVNPLVNRNREMRIIIAMAVLTGHQLDY